MRREEFYKHNRVWIEGNDWKGHFIPLHNVCQETLGGKRRVLETQLCLNGGKEKEGND